jgi:hypothetical protein
MECLLFYRLLCVRFKTIRVLFSWLKKPYGYDQRVVISQAGHFVLISGIKGCLYGNLGVYDK